MTLKEKEHKLKLIALILIVNSEYARRNPFSNFNETIAFYMEQVFWAMEVKRLMFHVPIIE